MKNLIYLSLLVITMSCKTSVKVDRTLLVNHLGYHTNGIKQAVYQSSSGIVPTLFTIIDEQGNDIYTGQYKIGGKVDKWHTGYAYRAEFSDLQKAGTYILKTEVDGQVFTSEKFVIRKEHIANDVLPLLTKAFQLQRCKPPYDDKDKQMSFFGDRNDIVDVSGGWYDASGEKGKYLSHLSFSNYMTPQQLPMMVWNMLETIEVIQQSDLSAKSKIINDLNIEAVHGADYLVRVQDKEGYFYTTVFAGWTKDSEQRQICAYEGQDGKRNDRYQAAFREGGGLAIAALARTSSSGLSGEFTAEQYLKSAIKGYAHLKNNNLKYTDDGKENIIDDYCALLAAIELFKATGEENYLLGARLRADKLTNRMMTDSRCKNWLRADDKGDRPYFHGAEAGLPIIAMVHYLFIEKEEARITAAKDFILKSLNYELTITNEVNNPFGYARQYVKATNEEQPRTAFFLPHVNETKYWWQGENARIASLATAMYKVQPLLSSEMKKTTRVYAANQLNWILGLNPYNVCMLHGAGRNNPDYKENGKSMNYLGGICNGITGGFDDENDIAFRPQPYDNDPAQRWRWSEQWLQHGGWFMPAIAYSSVMR